MKKIIALCLSLLLVTAIAGCSENDGIKNTIEGNMKTYYEMSDGTWVCNDISYEHRLEITGRMNNAARDTTFVYLSNLENITFEQALMGSLLSSNLNARFSVEDAVLVEMSSEQ